MSEQHPAVGVVTGKGIVVRGNDIDTDRIIPARYMKVVTFEGLGEYAFRDVRFDQDGKELKHPFNDPRLQAHNILFVNGNFGCGSSREHAPQALKRWGIDAVVGESFAEIFAGNCTAMGVPAITLTRAEITNIMDTLEAEIDTPLRIDLPAGTIAVGEGLYSFDIPPAYKNSLIAGTWDSTSVLLQNIDSIQETAESLPYVSGSWSR